MEMRKKCPHCREETGFILVEVGFLDEKQHFQCLGCGQIFTEFNGILCYTCHHAY